jgi:hypothetical protein
MQMQIASLLQPQVVVRNNLTPEAMINRCCKHTTHLMGMSLTSAAFCAIRRASSKPFRGHASSVLLLLLLEPAVAAAALTLYISSLCVGRGKALISTEKTSTGRDQMRPVSTVSVLHLFHTTATPLKTLEIKCGWSECTAVMA